jgi:hypothetical protein
MVLVILARVLMSLVAVAMMAVAGAIHVAVAAWMWLYDTSRSVLLWLESAIPGLPGVFGSAFEQIGTFFHNLINNAWQWGSNLIGMFINGIKSAVGGLFSTIGSIAHNITSMLGFHSPTKDGPLAQSDQWMPNMMRMFVAGIEAGAPSLQAALAKATSGMAAAPGFARLAGANVGAGSASAGSVVLHNQIYLDGKVVYDDFMGRMTGNLQMNGLGRAFR